MKVIGYKRFKLLLLIIISLGSVISNRAEGAELLQKAVQNGIVIFNQSNGQILFCPTIVNASTFTPYGSCKEIGTFSTSLTGTFQLDADSGKTTIFITNLVTGHVVECNCVTTEDGSAIPGLCTQIN